MKKTFDNKLKFNVHIAQKVKKENQALRMIKNTFSVMDKETFLPSYKSSGGHIWSTPVWCGIQSTRRIFLQLRTFREGQHWLKELSYENRLLSLGIRTLYQNYRRNEGI